MSISLQDLKNDAIGSDIKVSELLRKAKILAKKLGDNDFLFWIEKEASGYGKEKVPEYRIVHGEPKGHNPYRGWIPFTTGESKSQDFLSKKLVSSPIAELESIIEESKDSKKILHIPFSAETQQKMSEATGFNTSYSLHVSTNSIYGILDIVRNKIIDWVIENDSKEYVKNVKQSDKNIFPNELIRKLPKEIKILADDFNFNFKEGRAVTGMLILRRMLPLSIVRKFQKENKENDIKDENGDYFETKKLLNKIKPLLSSSRVYNDVVTYKSLIDSSQHSYTLKVQMSDTEGAAVKLRIFLDDIFLEKE